VNPPPSASPGSSGTKSSGLALASLILGICGIVLCLGPLAGIPAVICGHAAKSKIRESAGTLTGGGLATAGLVTGYVSIAWILIIGLLASMALPNFYKARKEAQYIACQHNLRALQAAKEMWATENSKPPGAVPTDADLFGVSKQIAQKPECTAGGAYQLNAVKESPTCSVHGALVER
jgi:hypothetical protein